MLTSLWLIHPDEAMCQAFRDRFAGLPGVRVIQATFEQLEPQDCFVTAGNAFGIMTAGIDAAVVRFFGESLMQRVQHRIMDDYFGDGGSVSALPQASVSARLRLRHRAEQGDPLRRQQAGLPVRRETP